MKKKIEEELKDIADKLKTQTNSLDISDFRDYTYEECRKVYKQIQHYIDDKNLLNELPSIIEKKKVEKYPEL